MSDHSRDCTHQHGTEPCVRTNQIHLPHVPGAITHFWNQTEVFEIRQLEIKERVRVLIARGNDGCL